ncbi:MAG: 4-(cytidine 5'-diphospho)-2-C-methyl-D-erythritol kinase, partial [Methylotenera sp.]|nr:4-(cytidine 5'-diphospho)-2-C-methyl-D-erythritol kinase [Methylotenera sp.]
AIPKTMSDFSEVANSGMHNLGAEFTNHLEKIVCSEYPAVLDCLTWLNQFGLNQSSDARMSGSGASVFLEVASEKIAAKICNQKPEGIQGFFAKGLNQHPLIDFASN